MNPSLISTNGIMLGMTACCICFFGDLWAGYHHKGAGKELNRSGYTAPKTAMLKSGNTLVVKSLGQLSRNKSDIKNELQYFRDHGIRLKVLDLPTAMIDYPAGQERVLDMVNNILIEVLSSITQQERVTMRQRQQEGITAAKSKGKHLGQPGLVPPENWLKVIPLGNPERSQRNPLWSKWDWNGWASISWGRRWRGKKSAPLEPIQKLKNTLPNLRLVLMGQLKFFRFERTLPGHLHRKWAL